MIRDMTNPIAFPSEADRIFEEAEAFQQLAPEERMRAILEVIAFGARLLEHSPQREEALRFQAAEEDKWQQIHKELFARHGIGRATSS